MAEINPELNTDELKKIYQIFKTYQEANVSRKPKLSEEEKRLREVERNNPYFSRYAYVGAPIDE